MILTTLQVQLYKGNAKLMPNRYSACIWAIKRNGRIIIYYYGFPPLPLPTKLAGNWTLGKKIFCVGKYYFEFSSHYYYFLFSCYARGEGKNVRVWLFCPSRIILSACPGFQNCARLARRGRTLPICRAQEYKKEGPSDIGGRRKQVPIGSLLIVSCPRKETEMEEIYIIVWMPRTPGLGGGRSFFGYLSVFWVYRAQRRAPALSVRESGGVGSTRGVLGCMCLTSHAWSVFSLAFAAYSILEYAQPGAEHQRGSRDVPTNLPFLSCLPYLLFR